MEETTNKPLLHISIAIKGINMYNANAIQNTIKTFKDRLSDRFEIIVSPANIIKLDTEGPLCNIMIDASTDPVEAVNKLKEFADRYCE